MKRVSVFLSISYLLLMLVLHAFIERSAFIYLALTFTGLFGAYYFLVLKTFRLPIGLGLGLAVLSRLILFPFLPSLSDDLYRFIWDGLLTINGTSPYSYTPAELMQIGTFEFLPDSLFDRLNSKTYYSVYPPMSQLFFAIGAGLSKGNVLLFAGITRLLLLLAEIGIVIVLLKLFKEWKINSQRVLIYALNPLVIVEGVGNLHFEIFMILFVLLSLFAYVQRRHILMAFFFGISISTKLVSAILWPFLIRWLGFRKWFTYSLVLVFTVCLMFFPLWDSVHFANFFSSLDLYFRSFEFNASIYYIARGIGSWFVGYNAIAWIGPGLAALVFVLICSLVGLGNADKTSVLNRMVLGLSLYLLFATTVHPWYVLLLLALSLLTDLRYPIVWTAVIWLSYSAYQTDPTKEIPWILLLEYAVLLAAICADRRAIRAVFIPSESAISTRH